MNEKNEIMTLEEVAEYLRISERTVYDWAQKGEIPCGKLGTAWRFKRDVIEKWVDERLNPQPFKQTASDTFDITTLLPKERIMILDTDNKEQALNQMIDCLVKTSSIKDKNSLKAAIFKREELMSTGIGQGIAIPHVRLPIVDDLMVAAAIIKNELKDYEAMDAEPVRLLFMIVARDDQHVEHLRALSSICEILKQEELKNSLLHSETTEELHNLLSSCR